MFYLSLIFTDVIAFHHYLFSFSHRKGQGGQGRNILDTGDQFGLGLFIWYRDRRTHASERQRRWCIIRPFLRTVSGNESMNEILQYLKKHGERLDSEIALATGTSLAKVRLQLSELSDKREIMTCHSIRFEKGKKIEGIRCRITGYIPPAAPGRKSKSQLQIS
jgi:hypothetical protein